MCAAMGKERLGFFGEFGVGALAWVLPAGVERVSFGHGGIVAAWWVCGLAEGIFGLGVKGR